MINTRFEVGTIGLLEGDLKRELEVFIGEDAFTQRKNYDEYYIKNDAYEVTLNFNMLRALSVHFSIRVWHDAIIVSLYK